ncbi:MAG: hypothetical protein APR54_07720, partial [Candidatus Cloacimonas sp. SDB]
MIINTKKFDWVLLLLLVLILGFGVVVIYSASTTKLGDNYQTESYYIRQVIWIIISLLILLILFKIPHSVIDFMITPFYFFSLILLVLVLFMPDIKGSHRWINLVFFNVQASELAKLATILMVSKVLSKPYLKDEQILIRTFPLIVIPFGLILLEPDLGTSLIFIVIWFTLLFFSSLPVFYILLIISPLLSVITSINPFFFIGYLLILCFLLHKSRLSYIILGFTAVLNSFIFIITPILWNSLKIYQQNRILTFLDPLRDPFGAGYQIIQAKIAVGSGGFFGKGFLEGT